MYTQKLQNYYSSISIPRHHFTRLAKILSSIQYLPLFSPNICIKPRYWNEAHFSSMSSGPSITWDINSPPGPFGLDQAGSPGDCLFPIPRLFWVRIALLCLRPWVSFPRMSGTHSAAWCSRQLLPLSPANAQRSAPELKLGAAGSGKSTPPGMCWLFTRQGECSPLGPSQGPLIWTLRTPLSLGDSCLRLWKKEGKL